MREGWTMIIDRDDFTDRMFYVVTKGREKVYFRSDTFGRLLGNKLIYQYDTSYELTPLAKTINLDLA